jgi:universal stress protein A
MYAPKTILCPTDFEEPSRAAFQVAKAIADKFGAAVIVMNVATTSPVYEEWGADLPLDAADLEDRAEALSEFVREAGGEIERLVLVGHAASVIVREAERRGCDLIVMGTAGRGGIGRLLLGSVAEHVSRKAPCPVMLARGGNASFTGTSAAAEAVEMIRRRQGRFGSTPSCRHASGTTTPRA